MLSYANKKKLYLKPIFYKYTTKLFFFMNCHFDQVLFGSYAISTKYCFNQVSFRSSVVRSSLVLIKCRFYQVSFRSSIVRLTVVVPTIQPTPLVSNNRTLFNTIVFVSMCFL